MSVEEIVALAMEELSSSSSSSSYSSSSASSSGNEDGFTSDEGFNDELLFPLLNVLLNGRKFQRVQNFLEIARAKSDEEFRGDFRIPRDVANKLIESLQASGFIPLQLDGKQKVSTELSLLMTLWFLANNEPHRVIANLFGISFSSVSRIIRRVIDWLMTLVPEKIKWPVLPESAEITTDFEKVSGISGCVGAIDGSHIFINQPKINGRDYYNRKQRYSVILQAVVDSKLKFRSIYCGDPGSYHDVRVLRRSEIFACAERQSDLMFPLNTFLLGDKGYNGTAKKWIICPFRDNGNLTNEEVDFNSRVSRARVVVERAFGILKGRFRRLQHIQLQDMQLVVKIIVASCTLHNICVDNGDDGEDIPADVNEMDVIGELVEGDVEERAGDRREQLFTAMYNI